MFKKFYLSLILLFLTHNAWALHAETYLLYGDTSTLTAQNLNGNFNNIRNVLNGGLDNTNADTARGFRFIEIVSSLPAAGNQGRTVFLTADNTLYFDTGSAWIPVVTISTAGVQGDMIYHNGTNWTVLHKDTNATRYVANTGTSNNPQWDKVDIVQGGKWLGQTAGDIIFASSSSVVSRLPIGQENQALIVSSSGLPSWGFASTATVYSTAGTYSFTPQTGIDKVYVTMCGGGGGGGSGEPNNGGGGGGGAASLIKHELKVATASSYTVVVGAGGAGGVGGPHTNGSNGGSSSFAGTTSPSSYTITTNGGSGGVSGFGSGDGGAGGTGNTSLAGVGRAAGVAYVYAGGAGGNYGGGAGGSGTTQEGGGGGASYLVAAGGVGSTGTGTPASPGFCSGGGGGGGSDGSSGAAGGSGLVIIEYYK
jgi:hypothetical protein